MLSGGPLNSSIRVTILGREYTLRSHGSSDQIDRVVRFVEDRLAEMEAVKSVDTRDITVLALLNVAGQYLRLLDQQKECDSQQDDRLNRLVSKVERVIDNDSGC